MSRAFSPYVGLAAFDAAHEAYFFGRSLDAAVLADNVLARPITVLYGTSGVGKSSVLNVGLPRALAALDIAVTLAVRRDWHEPAALGPWLDGVVTAARATPERPLILVLDQFEEYFHYRNDALGGLFERALALLLADPALEAHLLFSLRHDGLHLLDMLRLRLPAILDTTLELHHLDEASVREAIEAPIAEYNRRHRPPVALDADFASTLIGQLRPEGDRPRIELAYLQLALARIWEAEAGSGRLRTETLTRRLEGVREIARRHVEDVMAQLGLEERRLCATVFDRLVTPSGGKILLAAGDLARIAKVDEPVLTPVLGRLASGDSRLLRRVDLPGTGRRHGYEIVHDVLAAPILHWTERFAAEEERRRTLARTAERERIARERMRIVKTAAIVAALLFGSALAAAGFAYYQRGRAVDAEARVAKQLVDISRRRAELRATQSQVELHGGRPVTAMLVALEGMPRHPGDPERPLLVATEAALWAAWQASHETALLAARAAPVRVVAWSPDGRRIASAAFDGTVRIWDPRSPAAPVVLKGHERAVLALAWSPDGQRLATGSEDTTLRLWDPERPEALAVVRHPDWVTAVAWSPDGRRVATASRDHDARIWDPGHTDTPPVVLTGHAGALKTLAWSPDGRRIATGGEDGTLRIWDPEQGEAVAIFSGHWGEVAAVAWSPDGTRVASGSSDMTIRIWDPQDRDPPALLEGHGGAVSALAWSPDGGRLAEGDAAGAVRSWDPGAPKEPMALSGHGGTVTSLAWSPDGRSLATASTDGSLRVQSIDRTSLPVVLLGHDGPVRDVRWAPDGSRLASGGDDGTVRLWDPRSRDARAVRGGRQAGILGMAWNAAGGLASGSGDGVVELWDPAVPERPAIALGGNEVLTAMAVRADGERLATGSVEGVVRLWARDRPEPVAVWPRQEGVIRAVAWSPDGRRLALAAGNGPIGIWDAERGERVAELATPAGPVTALAWSRDGRLAGAAGDHVVRVWEPSRPEPIASFGGHTRSVAGLTWSPDGARLASASEDGTVRLWREGDAGSSTVLHAGSGGVFALAWSPDGRRLAAGAYDARIRIWDPEQLEPMIVLPGHEEAVSAVAWSPDGQSLASGSRDRTVRLWRVFQDHEALIAAARAALPIGHDRLTAEEQARLLVDGR